MTNLGFDVQDVYVERMDLRNGEYLFQGKVERAKQEREVILVKGRPAEELTMWVTRHGPVFDTQHGAPMALKWSAAEPELMRNIFPELDRARNWEEFEHAVSRFGGPGQNFVYGDVDGNIGYQASGKLPIRRNYYGDVPVDGSSGENEWDGYIPFEELPHALNPPNGLVVTANQNPFPSDYKYHVSGFFDSPYRSNQIFDRLSAMAKTGGGKLKPADSLSVQMDVYSAFNKFLAGQIVRAFAKHDASDAMFKEAVEMLKSWDGQMDQDRAEPLVATLTFEYLRRSIAERASPNAGRAWETHLSTAVVERVLQEKPEGWFADYDELLLRCFADAMQEGRRIQGASVKHWKWGKYMYRTINHPIGSRIPVVGRYFNIGPAPMSGGPTTVKQTTMTLGPSERMDASTGDWDASLMEIPLGESGNVASSHYRDEWDAYYYGRSFPMQFGKVDVKSTVTFVPKH